MALIFPLFSGRSAAAKPVDYPLVCRGGGLLKTVDAGTGNVGFEFIRGNKPAGEGLEAGACSWLDRAMYTSEPNRVSQYVGDVPGAPKPAWYDELRSSDRYWTFMVSNDGKGQLIATSARPGGVTGTTTTFKPPLEGLKTWVVSHEWHNDRWNCPDFRGGAHAGGVSSDASEVLVGYVNSYDGGSGPLPCESNSKVDYRGTIWFDLGEIFKTSPTSLIADKAILKFKKADGSVAVYDGNRKPITRVCEDRLFVSNGDPMKGFPEGTHVPEGEFIAAIDKCPAEGCSIDVTKVVNKWIAGEIERYGFVIVGEDENWLDKLIPHDSSVCETRYTDFSLTVTYQPLLLAIPPAPPKERPPRPGDPGPSLDIRKNVALASNGGTAIASSTSSPYSAAAAIDGEHRGLNWLSGGGWQGAGSTNNDSLQVDFGDFKMIDEIDVFMIQDDYASPIEPSLDTPSTSYGLTNFTVQYRNKFGVWTDVKVLGNPVIDNKKAWRQFKFTPVRTKQIRVLVTKTPDGWSRIAELEAWGY